MKTLAIIIATLFLATYASIGCGSKSDADAQSHSATLETLLEEVGYERAEVYIRYEIVVPDSMRLIMAKWITETVAAASSRMTGGDYEDPEDLVEEVSDQGKKIFGEKREVISLAYVPKGGTYSGREVVGIENFTPQQRKIYDFLAQH